MSNLIIISSAICTVNKPLGYTPIRSFFTHEQRYEQTLQTIESIRKMIPESYIVITEGTEIPDYMEGNILSKVDYYYNVSKIDWVSERVNSPAKGHGEVASILAYFKSPHFEEKKESFKSISKISGRYKIRSDFKFDVLDDRVICKMEFNNRHHPSGVWMSTMFYTIPKHLFSVFIKSFEDCFNNDEAINDIAIEHILPLCMFKNNIKIANKIGLLVEGEYGPWGGYVCH